MSEKRCKLCNKPYEHHYALFGRGCLENIYELLNYSKPPRIALNKELYLCTKIAWKNHKFFLSKKKKYALTQKYIALNYLNRMNYEFLDDVKEKILNDINNISVFSKNIVETISFTLNDIYKLFNYTQKFNEIIKEFQSINLEKIDEKMAKDFIERMSFIFDVTKISSPIAYAVFYSMQYVFWQVVVIGGLLVDMKLSAKLLRNSLVAFGKEPNDLIIDDDETINEIKESKEFNKKIKELLEKYCKDTNQFSANSLNNDDCNIEFNDKDLFLAIHGSPISVDIEKSEIKGWNIRFEITDTYDFTDFKNLKEYATSNASLPMSIFSTILNNFAVVSSEYGVIKPYKVTILIQEKDYMVEEVVEKTL